jgi:hypothetical protein
MTRLLLLLITSAAPELLQGVTHRAVTLEPGERRIFRIPNLNKVTASSGRCLEEGMDSEEPDSLFIEGTCSGVRTALAWRHDGVRIHVLACAEDPTRPPAVLALRKTLQTELRGWKSATACVRNGHVELWGWVKTAAELKTFTDLEKKYGLERVRNFVELAEIDEP